MKSKWRKEIYIPFHKCKLIIHIGEKGKEAFEEYIKSYDSEWKADVDYDGMQYLNRIWVEDVKDHKILMHEIGHYIEWLYTELYCEEESEFKACLFSHVLCSVIEVVTE